jgi:hypothetical protein
LHRKAGPRFVPRVDESMARRATSILRLAGGAMVVLSVALLIVLPAAPARRNLPGLQSPIIGFELARTPDDVAGLLGEPGTPERAEYAARMDRGNRLDFAFMIAYAAFHAAIALRLAARGRLPRPVLVVLLVLAADMLLFDALENRELLLLSTAAPSPDMDAALARLHVFTLLKWYAIFGSAGLLAPFLWREPDWWRFAAPLFALAALLGVVGLGHPPSIEWGAYAIALAWLLTWIHALRRA